MQVFAGQTLDLIGECGRKHQSLTFACSWHRWNAHDLFDSWCESHAEIEMKNKKKQKKDDNDAKAIEIATLKWTLTLTCDRLHPIQSIANCRMWHMICHRNPSNDLESQPKCDNPPVNERSKSVNIVFSSMLGRWPMIYSGECTLMDLRWKSGSDGAPQFHHKFGNTWWCYPWQTFVLRCKSALWNSNGIKNDANQSVGFSFFTDWFNQQMKFMEKRIETI